MSNEDILKNMLFACSMTKSCDGDCYKCKQAADKVLLNNTNYYDMCVEIIELIDTELDRLKKINKGSELLSQENIEGMNLLASNLQGIIGYIPDRKKREYEIGKMIKSEDE